MGRCSLRRESDIEYLFDLNIGHCRLRSSCVVIENRKIELTESVKHRSMRGFHFTAPLQPSAVALSGACCPQRRNRRKEQGDSCWVSPDPKLLETPSCYLSGETADRDFFPLKIASLGIRKGFINRFPVLQATDRIEEDIFISLGSDSLKTWKSAAAFAKNNHTMTLSNNQMLNDPTPPVTPKITSRHQLQSTQRSGRSSTVNDSMGTPASSSSRNFQPTHVVAAATQTSARSAASVPSPPRSGRGHVQTSPSAGTSRPFSSKYSMITPKSTKDPRDSARSTTTSTMSTARAEATLKKLEAERKTLEYRLKKVEEELEQEEALGKEGLHKHLHGNSSRMPH